MFYTALNIEQTTKFHLLIFLDSQYTQYNPRLRPPEPELRPEVRPTPSVLYTGDHWAGYDPDYTRQKVIKIPEREEPIYKLREPSNEPQLFVTPLPKTQMAKRRHFKRKIQRQKSRGDKEKEVAK